MQANPDPSAPSLLSGWKGSVVALAAKRNKLDIIELLIQRSLVCRGNINGAGMGLDREVMGEGRYIAGEA